MKSLLLKVSMVATISTDARTSANNELELFLEVFGTSFWFPLALACLPIGSTITEHKDWSYFWTRIEKYERKGNHTITYRLHHLSINRIQWMLNDWNEQENQKIFKTTNFSPPPNSPNSPSNLHLLKLVWSSTFFEIISPSFQFFSCDYLMWPSSSSSTAS